MIVLPVDEEWITWWESVVISPASDRFSVEHHQIGKNANIHHDGGIQVKNSDTNDIIVIVDAKASLQSLVDTVDLQVVNGNQVIFMVWH